MRQLSQKINNNASFMFKSSKNKLSPNHIGAILITITSLFGVLQGALTKELSALHPTQILFFKSSIGILLLFGSSKNFRSAVKIKDIKGHLLKGIAGFLGNLLSITALLMLSLTDCISIAMTSAIFTSVGGIFIYKEKPKPFLFYSLTLCMIGVMIIATPSFMVDYLPGFITANIEKDLIIANDTKPIYFMIPLLSAIMFAVSSLTIKRLNRNKNNSQSMLFALMIIMSTFSLPLAIYNWHPMTVKHLIILSLMSILYQLSHFMMIKTYSIADASFVAPFKYLRFPIAIFISLIIGDVVDLNSLLGGAFIIIANYLLLAFSLPQREKSK